MNNSPETDQAKQEPQLVGICSNGLLEELSGIIASAMDRSGEIHGHDIKWLLELPLTDSEYKRLRHIVSSSNDKFRNAGGQSPAS